MGRPDYQEILGEHSGLPSRREMLRQAGAGFGALALSYMLEQESHARTTTDPRLLLAPKAPHFSPTAKSVIFLFMEGGPSHIDLFDPKPLLQKLAGQQLPKTFKPVITAMGETDSPLLASKRRWKQYGQAGLWISDWLPHIATRADDIAVLRSVWGNGINHSGGVCQMNTGAVVGGRPSLGSWVTYGLGSENRDMPAFVVMQDSPAQVTNGARNWGAGFMPAVYQGTRLEQGPEPIPNLRSPVSPTRQQEKLGLLERLNRHHARQRPEQTELEARIASYELAFRMQAHAPEVVALEQESKATQALYGMDDAKTAAFGRLCLLSRRMVERGTRFVQLYHGAGSKWDAHAGIEKNHATLCHAMDKPVAGLLYDLKQRGLLEQTLVVWGGEFGRTPMSEKGDGRDHNPYGFTMWLAGGGVKGGRALGATDELGLHAVEDRLHIHDFHATILHLLGVSHMKLVYQHKGRPERPTLNEGEAYTKLTAG